VAVRAAAGDLRPITDSARTEPTETKLGESKGTVADLLLMVEVGRLELWPAAWRGAWWRLCWRSDLRFLNSCGDRWCPLHSSTYRPCVYPPCTGGLRSRPVADPCGAPVLRDQGPIGRPGTARPIKARRGVIPWSVGLYRRRALDLPYSRPLTSLRIRFTLASQSMGSSHSLHGGGRSSERLDGTGDAPRRARPS
jgi:hypothetical protein